MGDQVAGRAPGRIDPLRRAVDLVNALVDAGAPLVRPPGGEPSGSAAADPAGVRRRQRDAVVAVLRAHGEREADLDLTADDVAEVRAAAGTIAAILATTDPDQAAARLNAALDACAARPRLSDHDGQPWHLHVAPADAGWGGSLLAASALALATALADRGRCPWGPCAAAGCARFHAHDGRGSPRRFCSTRCATRTRVASHRRLSRGR